MPDFRVDTRTVSVETWEAAIRYYNSHKGEHGISSKLLRMFGVNVNALKRRIKSGNTGVTVWGRKTLFTEEDEEAFKKVILDLDEANMGIRKGVLLETVQKYAESINATVPTKYWLDSFLRRHPEFSDRLTSGLTRARYNAVREDIMTSFYDLLEEVSDGIPPERIYIMDETGLETDRPTKVSKDFVAVMIMWKNLRSFNCIVIIILDYFMYYSLRRHLPERVRRG